MTKFFAQLAGRRQQPREPRRPPGAGPAGAVAGGGLQRGAPTGARPTSAQRTTPRSAAPRAGAVGELNQITTEIAALNDQIGKLVLAGAVIDPVTQAVIKPGQAPNDLLDRRDLLLDKPVEARQHHERHVRRPQPRHRRRRGHHGGRRRAAARCRSPARTSTRPFTNGDLAAGRLQALEDAYVNMLDESGRRRPTRAASTRSRRRCTTTINTAHAHGIDLDGRRRRRRSSTCPARAARRRGPPPRRTRHPDRRAHDRRRARPRRARARTATRSRILGCGRRRRRPAARPSRTTTRAIVTGVGAAAAGRRAHRRRHRDRGEHARAAPLRASPASRSTRR